MRYSMELRDGTTDPIKAASKKAIQITAEATGDLMGNKITDKMTSVSNKISTKELYSNDETEDVEITTLKKITRRRTTNY